MIDQYLTPQEMRRLASALLAVVGFIALMALFGFLIVPGERNANRPIAGAPVSAPQGETGWLDLTDYPPTRAIVVPPVDPKTVMDSTPALLARGKSLYEQNCAACHGSQGRGDGPAAKGLNPPPRDFTQAAGWKNGYRKEDIWKTLQEGIRGSAMVSFDVLSKKDRMALVHDVQSLGSFDHSPEDRAKLDELAKVFASAGEAVPARIPVSAAERAVEREFHAAPPLAKWADAPPAVRALVSDPARAAQTLEATPLWKTDVNALALAVTRGVGSNGFTPAVATLTLGQWRDLQNGLLGMVQP